MVTVAHTTLRDLTQAELELLPQDERLSAFGSDLRRRQFQCGRSLLRLLLQETTGVPASRHKLDVEDSGKPVCVGGPAISISHSGNWVVCCVADAGEIGIDIERVDASRNATGVTDRFFSTAEQRWLAKQPADRFFMLWVLKEAYVKAHGKSVFGGLDRLGCTVEPPTIDVQKYGDTNCALALYRQKDRLLALATTQASLQRVAFRHWLAGEEQLTGASDLVFVANTDHNA